MVVTRRSTANGVVTNGTSKLKLTELPCDTIQVLQPPSSKIHSAAATPKSPSAAPNAKRLCSISEYDLSLTSPPTCDTPGHTIMNTPKRKHDASSHVESRSASALHPLAPKGENATGGALNPILVTDSPPPTQAPNRKRQRKSAPHKFLDRGYKKLYSYPPTRPVLAPQPAIGSTFTGHKSHDIYRMMNAKMAAESGRSAKETYSYRGFGNYGQPLEVRDPMSAQYHGRYPTAMNQQQSPLIQYYDHYAPQLNVYPKAPTQDEETLRKKAVQYIREFSRPSPRKRRLSDADPDETSCSDSESQPPAKPTRSPLFNSTPHTNLLSQESSPFISIAKPHSAKSTNFHHHDSNIAVTQLTEHTSLLTSLLQIYPYSSDQKGLREDIAMLVSVQNQRVTEWMNAESESAYRSSKRRRRSNTDSAISVSSQCGARVVQSAEDQQRLEQERGQDEDMRRVLSATANIWQDGSGMGVADVFANVSASSPARSLDGKVEGTDGRVVGAGGEVSRSEGGDLSLDGELASFNGNAGRE